MNEDRLKSVILISWEKVKVVCIDEFIEKFSSNSTNKEVTLLINTNCSQKLIK